MQKGFIFPSLYIYLGLGAVIVFMYLRGNYYEVKSDLAESRYETLATNVATIGAEAQRNKIAKEKEDKLKKDKADNELKTLRADNAEFRRLRDSNPGSRRLPQAPANSRNPELSCFDRASLERAYGELVKEVRGIADEGTEATLSLDTVKRWAQSF